MKLGIAFLCYLVTLVSADSGILQIRYEDHQETTFCIYLRGDEVHLPDTKEDFYPLVDLTPDLLCEVPTDSSHLNNSILLVSGSVNCTISDRAAIAEEVDAAGLVVVDIGSDLKYGNTSYNMSVVWMSEEDYNTFDKMQKKHSGEIVQAVLYSPELPSYDPNLFVILTLAVSIVAVGGYWSGLTSFQQYKRKKGVALNNVPAANHNDEDDDDDDDSMVISTKLILIWVVMIIFFLMLLFFFYNIFVYVVILMFCLGAWSSLYICLYPLVRRVFKSKASTPLIPYWKVRCTYVSIALSAVCLVPVVCWFVYRKEEFAWILQDLLGAAFCISMLKMIHLPDLKKCVLLLGLLFVYDLFFVFITPLLSKDGESVMLKVATGGEGATEKLPILFMFPSLTCSPYRACNGYSLLGFGDVLIPGLFVGFCHGFDMKVRSKKIYFATSLAAYAFGLALCFVALIIMQAGQPALVYIVPSTLLTVTLIGGFRRELKELWTGQPTKGHIPLIDDVHHTS